MGNVKDSTHRPVARQLFTALALVILTLLVYGWRLAEVPPYLKYEEVFFALESNAIATSWHDTHGRFLPLYFQVYENAWYQPILVYWGALFQMLLPLTDSVVRYPTVCVAGLDVALVYLVARRLFGREYLALTAAALLALTPAHFILGRVGMDYLYPVPFMLAWLLCLITFLQERALWSLVASAVFLGIGFFSYIAAAGQMPMYLLMTIAALLASGHKSLRAHLWLVTGFAVPIAAGAWLAFQTPDYVSASLARYGPGTGHAGDPLQRIRELLNYTNISAHVGVYFDYLNPGYLFFSGGSNPADSTRAAGIFLLPLMILIPVGIYETLRQRTAVALIVVAGFFTAPIAATTLLEPYAADRELVVLPFGVLLATYGVQALWPAVLRWRVGWILTPLAVTGAGAGVAYGLWTLIGRGHLTNSTIPFVVLCAGLYAAGRLTDAIERWSVLAGVLLILVPLQFGYFYRDYMTDYRIRAITAFGSNLRGAVEELMRLVPADGTERVFISEGIPFADYYVRWYAIQNGRGDLHARVTAFVPANLDTDALPPGALVVTGLGAADQAAIERLRLDSLARVLDPTGSPAFFLSRRAATR